MAIMQQFYHSAFYYFVTIAGVTASNKEDLSTLFAQLPNNEKIAMFKVIHHLYKTGIASLLSLVSNPAEIPKSEINLAVATAGQKQVEVGRLWTMKNFMETEILTNQVLKEALLCDVAESYGCETSKADTPAKIESFVRLEGEKEAMASSGLPGKVGTFSVWFEEEEERKKREEEERRLRREKERKKKKRQDKRLWESWVHYGDVSKLRPDSSAITLSDVCESAKFDKSDHKSFRRSKFFQSMTKATKDDLKWIYMSCRANYIEEFALLSHEERLETFQFFASLHSTLLDELNKWRKPLVKTCSECPALSDQPNPNCPHTPASFDASAAPSVPISLRGLELTMLANHRILEIIVSLAEASTSTCKDVDLVWVASNHYGYGQPTIGMSCEELLLMFATFSLSYRWILRAEKDRFSQARGQVVDALLAQSSHKEAEGKDGDDCWKEEEEKGKGNEKERGDSEKDTVEYGKDGSVLNPEEEIRSYQELEEMEMGFQKNAPAGWWKDVDAPLSTSDRKGKKVLEHGGNRLTAEEEVQSYRELEVMEMSFQADAPAGWSKDVEMPQTFPDISERKKVVEHGGSGAKPADERLWKPENREIPQGELDAKVDDEKEWTIIWEAVQKGLGGK